MTAATEALRTAGNAALKAGDAAGAIARYTEALEELGELAVTPDTAGAVLLCNRAAAHLRSDGGGAAALRDAAAALRRDPGHAKALFRKAQALTALAAEHAARVARRGGAWALAAAAEADAAAMGQWGCDGAPAGLARRTEFGLLLAAQEALAAVARSDGGVRSALAAARDRALRAAFRGAVELRRSGVHDGGIGLFATRRVDPGEVLLEDEPAAWHKGAGDWRERGIEVVSKLQKAAQTDPVTVEWVVGLHSASGDAATEEEALFCVWDVNGHAVGDIDCRVDEDSNVGVALYVAGSRVNHSCTPNAVQSFCPNTGRIRIQALDALAEGDEVLISYTAPYASAATRRKKLGFDCRCPRCARAAEGDDPLGGKEDAAAALQRQVDEAQEAGKAAQLVVADAARRVALRDDARRRAVAAAAAAVAELGEDHEVVMNATLLCTKLCAGAEAPQVALPHAVRLQRLTERHLHKHWPLQVWANVHLAVQEGLARDGGEEELLPRLHAALTSHRISIGCPFADDSSRHPGDAVLDRDDSVGFFWRRYRDELSALEIDSPERARLLFTSSAAP